MYQDYLVFDMSKVDPSFLGKFCVVRRVWYATGTPDLFVLCKQDTWHRFDPAKKNIFTIYKSWNDANEDRTRKWQEDMAKMEAKGKLVGLDHQIPVITTKEI